MDWAQIAMWIMGAIGTLGIAFFGAGYWRSQFSKGSKEQNAEVLASSQTLVEFWKSQAEDYKRMIIEKEQTWNKSSAEKEKHWNEKFENLTREIGEVRGQLTATEKQRAEYEAILKDRNPETQTFMKEVTETMGQILTSMQKTNEFMQKINEQMEQQAKGFVVESKVTTDKTPVAPAL